MAELRIILLVLGVLLVLGIYLFERLRRRRLQPPPADWYDIDDYNEQAVSDEDFSDDSNALSDTEEWVGKAFSARRGDVLSEAHLDELKGLAGREQSPLSEEMPELRPLHSESEPQEELDNPQAPGSRADTPLAEEVIVLTLMAAEGTALRGTRLLKALQQAGLNHGDMEIFHFIPDGHRTALFSVANILEPGRFELSEMAQLETPGIALFMQLPAEMAGPDALKLLLQRARQIAAQLNATLCDGQRRPLDEPALAQLEQRVAAYPARR